MSEGRSAKAVFKDLGTNFMTPTVIGYGWVNRHVAWELSTGTGIVGEGIWGVSFRDERCPNRTLDGPESLMVLSEAAGYELIDQAKEEYGTSD